MTIILKIDDLILDLFPRTKETNFDRSVLKDELTEFYSVGPYKPKINIENDTVTIEIDISLIEKQEQNYRKVLALCEKGQYAEAKKILHPLLEKAQHVSEYHRILGQIYFDEGKFDDAIDGLIDALRWDPRNSSAFIVMGNIYGKHKGDLETAIKYFERALEINPNDAISMDNIGVILMQEGKTEKAKEYFEKALKADPEYPNTYHALAMIADIDQDYKMAFQYAVTAMKKNKKRDELYNQSINLALESAKHCIRKDETVRLISAYVDKLESHSGRKIEITPDESVSSSAKLEVAENYNRNEHVIRYKPNYAAVNHLIMHELVHLEYIVQAREARRNELFISNKGHQREFEKSFKKHTKKMQKKGFDDDTISKYYTEIFNGLNLQMFNTPIDLFIENDLYTKYPDIQPVQFLSLVELLKQGIKATTDPRIISIAPDSVLSNEEDPYGLEGVDPAKERKMKRFLETHKDKDINMAVTIYMVESLQYFADMPKDKVKNIAVEIAELGMHGISPDKKGYRVRSIPDTEFSGYHLLAYYYVSWAIALPEMLGQLQMPFEKEYEVAKGFVEESSGES
jgi:Tfp pilus assembly protein PilF